jgi:hypothetical protein
LLYYEAFYLFKKDSKSSQIGPKKMLKEAPKHQNRLISKTRVCGIVISFNNHYPAVILKPLTTLGGAIVVIKIQ